MHSLTSFSDYILSKRFSKYVAAGLIIFLTAVVSELCAQNIYELRKLTEEDWLGMTTEERLNSIGMANKHSQNQTFLGDFGKFFQMQKKWGYDFYEMDDNYQNYSFRGFDNYNIIEERRNRWSYNEFGDRISKMRHSASVWNERYSGDGTHSMTATNNYINAISSGNTDGVWLAKESTDDWAVSVIGAGALRAKFTPLTLSIPNINGMKVDFQSANTTLSILNSAPMNSATYGGVTLRGGTFRRKIGILTIGATYVNQYSVQGNRQGGDDWYGTVNNYAPVPLILAIRFLDDSPDDNSGGAVVHNIRIKVDGKYRDDIIPTIIRDDITREKTTVNINPTEVGYLRLSSQVMNAKPNHDHMSLNESIPKYADYLYYIDYMKGQNIKKVSKDFNASLASQYYQLVDPNSKIQADGTETITYWYDVSSINTNVNRIEAEATVANDYRIQVSTVGTREIGGGHDKTGKNLTYYQTDFWRTVAQADGNVKDNSNLATVKVDFGLQVATMIYGVDASIDYRGLKITGEFVTNSNHYMFPDGKPGDGEPAIITSGMPARTGHKWSESDNAYYVTLEKSWKNIGVAGEIFKMGKFYKPWLDYKLPKTQFGGYNSRNDTVRLPLIEDNDDDDLYPDTMFSSRTFGYRIYSLEDPDGVFPGNDQDNDGVADNNKNNNDLPDYEEPFLLFDSDPDEFVFGNDFNNNNIPDFREDDMKLDTPYDLDRKGYHFHLTYSPAKSVNLITGTMRTTGVGLDTRNYDDYVKLQVTYDFFDIGRFYAEYRYEEIQDNIRDSYMQVSTKIRTDYLLPGITTTIGRFTRDVYFDELEYKNSKVNRIYLNSAIRALPSITIENHVKFEKNKQLKGILFDSTYQQEESLNTLAIINKVIYTKKFGRWIFSPGIKMRFYKKDRSDIPRPGDYYVTRIPLVMFRYELTPMTKVSFGLQGLPKFEFDHKDFVQSENDFKMKTYMMEISNRTTYFGYDIWAATGVKVNDVDYQGIREFESLKSSTVFVNVFLGW